MAEYTKNLDLFKPGSDEQMGIEGTLDENFVKIDNKLGNMLKDLDGKNWPTAGERINEYQKSLKNSQGDINKLKKKNPNARLDTHFFRTIAHKGAKWVAPENTLMAFAYAIDMGFWGIQTIIQLTSDNKWVCFNNATLDNRSSGTGPIGSKTLAQLRAFDFGSWYSMHYKDARIATIDDYLETCRLGEVVPYIELRVSHTDLQIQGLVELIRDYDMEDSVVLISDYYTNLQNVRYYSDYMALGYIRDTAFTQKDITDTEALQNAFIVAERLAINTSNMKLAKKARMSVEAYVVATNNELRKLMRLGVRGAQTNDIPFARGY